MLEGSTLYECEQCKKRWAVQGQRLLNRKAFMLRRVFWQVVRSNPCGGEPSRALPAGESGF
jgi:hypothetical protein